MRSSRLRLSLATAVIICVSLVAPRAQQSPALEQELRRIFQTNDYAAQSFGPAVWFDAGAYGVVERAEKVRVLVAYDASSGRRDVLADAALLTPKGASEPLTADRRRLRVVAGSHARPHLHQHQARVARRTRAATTGCSHRAARQQADRARQAVRLHGLPEPDAQHLRG